MQRPLLTLALCAYNQERFVGEAVAGALAQTYSPLEVILSDDHSADGTFEVMRNTAANYRGPHRLVLNQTSCNLGIGGHLNRVMELARGELVLAAAGDDVSLPSRAQQIFEAWDAMGRKACSLYSNMRLMDKDGKLDGLWGPGACVASYSLADLLETGTSPVFGASHAWSAEVFRKFGALDPKITHEDWVIPFRSALLGGIRYIPTPLVCYRRHGGNTYQACPAKQTVDVRRRRYDWLVDEYVLKFASWQRDVERAVQLGVISEGRAAAILKPLFRLKRPRDLEQMMRKANWQRKLALFLQLLWIETPGVRRLLFLVSYYQMPILYSAVCVARARRGEDVTCESDRTSRVCIETREVP